MDWLDLVGVLKRKKYNYHVYDNALFDLHLLARDWEVTCDANEPAKCLVGLGGRVAVSVDKVGFTTSSCFAL